MRDRTVRGYLDGTLVSEAVYPRVDTVLAIAGRDEKTGDVIIKTVNTSAEPVPMTIRVNGAAALKSGRVTVLTSASPTDENSFDAPTKIAPVTSALTGVTPSFTYTFAPYSLTILRVSR